jgi:hypothetical protein
MTCRDRDLVQVQEETKAGAMMDMSIEVDLTTVATKIIEGSIITKVGIKIIGKDLRFKEEADLS